MQQRRPFWFLTNAYGWVILVMSGATAYLISEWWVILLGVSGYLVALLVDLLGGHALGRTGAVRLARAVQENRELQAEKTRLLGAIRERDEKLAALQRAAPKQVSQETAPENPKTV